MERTPEPLGKALEEVPPPEGELAKVAGGTGPAPGCVRTGRGARAAGRPGA